MDVLMPGTGSLDALRRVRAATSCAILVVTESVQANAARVFEAMGHGALDAVDAPIAGGSLLDSAAPLLAKIATIARLLGEHAHIRGTVRSGNSSGSQQQTLIAIGASAGGPAAVAALLRSLPRKFPGAIVLIQHVEAQFASGMAEWLSEQSPMPVVVAKENQRPTPGMVLLAGTLDHLALKAPDRLGYTPEPHHYVYRPSIDVFFHSVSQHWRGPAVGVLLTGMGRDGAIGLKALRDHGYHTIAQNEASSAVYGMPKAAASLKAAVEILPLEQIAPRLVELVVGAGSPLSGRFPPPASAIR
jgi:chemotaxis response regulator CheB